jgi:hypothetical protein
MDMGSPTPTVLPFTTQWLLFWTGSETGLGRKLGSLMAKNDNLDLIRVGDVNRITCDTAGPY